MGSLKQQTIVLRREEIDAIHAVLYRGRKRQLAEYLGILPPLLSRYINYRNGKYFDGFKMPKVIYDKIIEFLQTSTPPESR